MTTPRTSMSGAFPADSMKGPIAMQPVKKIIPRKVSTVKFVTAGSVENEWKKLCSRPKADVVLLSAEEKKEQPIEIKEEVVELTEVSAQPLNEEDIEIIPVQEEEEEETEANFPEPPKDQESSPIENDSVP
uniref:Membrane spanning 4-domains A1 n=1 Tax=Molossus molossus TaxID=27622 RepID=A0A7J8ETB4_MOLMO|nr:membrane spanning 4-domains A1 [Molossus molossus]